METPNSSHESLPWPQEPVRGVWGRQPSIQSQPQTGCFLIGQTLRLHPSHLLVPFIQHRLVCAGSGISKTRESIPNTEQVTSWPTDDCVTWCKSCPFSGPHVLGPADSNVPAALVFPRKTRIHTCHREQPPGPWLPNSKHLDCDCPGLSSLVWYRIMESRLFYEQND